MKLQSRAVTVHGVATELIELGAGEPLLFLHSGEGPSSLSDAYLRQLGTKFRVLAPWHPGFGPAKRPPDFRDVGDLAYFYLDLLDELALEKPVLVGAAFGGWIAAEIAVRRAELFSGLVLVSPYGVKAGDRETRDIVDFFALTPTEWYRAAFKNPELAKRDYQGMPEDELIGLLRSRESLAWFGWRPFMHNPSLRRWLHRITIPTLLIRGSEDQVVSAASHAAFINGIPGAKAAVVPDAGHYPHIEQPAHFAALVAGFAGANVARAA